MNSFSKTQLLLIAQTVRMLRYEPLSVWNAITKLELKVGLAKAKSGSGAYIWKVMGIK